MIYLVTLNTNLQIAGEWHTAKEELKMECDHLPTKKEAEDYLNEKYFKGWNGERNISSIISIQEMEEELDEEVEKVPDTECNECGWKGHAHDLDFNADDIECCPDCFSEDIYRF